MSDAVAYYTSRGRLVHAAVNIALAPVLLYLFRFWSWPPELSQLPWFLVSGGIALAYVNHYRRVPKFVIGEDLICAGRRSWRRDQLVAVQPVLRQLRIVVDEGGVRREAVIAMGWASAGDYREIANRLGKAASNRDTP